MNHSHLPYAMRAPSPSPLLRFLLATLATGCGSQVSREYYGESLLALRGSVILDSTRGSPSNLVPVLAYDRPVRGAISRGFQLVDVVYRGSFPSRFALDVFAPPPPEAFREIQTPLGRTLTYAWGTVAAVAPEHPSVLAASNLREWSYCLGKACFVDRSRCASEDNCYYERERCSLPDRFDVPNDAYSNCREVATRGDLSTLPPSTMGIQRYGDASFSGDSAEITYTVCPIFDESCEQRPDGTCRPADSTCYSRVVECTFDEARARSLEPLTYPEVEEEHWKERSDLSNCGLVTQLGNPDLAEDTAEWFAGLSDDAYIVYLPEGFDPLAFEEMTGVPAPSHPGYSFLLLTWNQRAEAAFAECRARTEQPMIDAYNAEHGTNYSAEVGVPSDTELGTALLENYVRCYRRSSGEWLSDPGSRELSLHVGPPSAYAY